MQKRLLRILTAAVLCVLMSVCTCTAETDWYTERADALVDDLRLLSADRTYLSLYSGNNDLIDLALAWHEELSAEPICIGRYYMPTDLIRMGLAIGGTDLSDTALKYINRSADTFILSTVTASQGVNFLAASSMLRIGESFIMPEDFKPCIVLYEYENLCVAVLFTQTGEGVVGASAAICTDSIKQYCMSIDTADGTLMQPSSVGGALLQDAAPTQRPSRAKHSFSDTNGSK